MDLNLHQKRVLSQWGQDGVLEKIFDIIGTTNKYFVEFGSSGNDNGMGNTAYLRRKGFDGLLMDGSERPYNQDVNDKKYEVNIEMISASNINGLFEKYNVPIEFDFLSIDIDGQDFHVWNNIEKYSPRVVSIEINYHIPTGLDKVMPLNDKWVWNTGDIPGEMYGSSITALKNLGNKKGYALVATCMCDAIFVRNDLVYNRGDITDLLFKNINNEHELVKLNSDIYLENSKFDFTKNQNHFNNTYFVSSSVFL